MDSPKLIRLYDRSRVTTDWKCPRSRYWQYEYKGKGIVGGGLQLYLYMGSAIHDGLSALARGVDIDLIADAARKQMIEALLAHSNGEVEEFAFANEQAALVEGIIRGFHKYVWPSLIARYPRVLHVEEEMLLEHDGLGFMSKPDLVLATEDGSEVVYVEYKSTASKKDDWINSWSTAVQLHSTIRAVEATTGVKINSVIVQGLYKGYVSYGKQNSPFCYCYKRNGNPPFTQDAVAFEYKAGFKRFPVWELEGGVKGWIEGMPEDVLASQFPQTPPIFVKDDLIDAFFLQRTVREKEIALALDWLEATEGDEEAQKMVMSTSFPQKFSECQPGWGSPCGYRLLCHGPQRDPLDSGFVWREPHHLAEMEQWKERENGQSVESV